MRIAYLDCFAGITGDMVLGALLDVGVDTDLLLNDLRKLPLTKFVMAAKSETRSGIGGTKVSVKAMEKGVVRTYSNIRRVIEDSELQPEAKKLSLSVFHSLAEAQSRVFHKNIETVHFHEVGAVDSIVDIVGSAVAFTRLGIDKVLCSPLPMGIGMTRTDHGLTPIPSPVTLEILRGVPVYSTGIQSELVTPTGAAIARAYADDFCNMPPLVVDDIGYGAGRTELEIPNMLRLIIGESEAARGTQEVIKVSARLVEAEPQSVAGLMQRLLSRGAIDVWAAAIAKPENPRAVEVSFLSPAGQEKELITVLLSETEATDVITSRQSRLIP